MRRGPAPGTPRKARSDKPRKRAKVKLPAGWDRATVRPISKGGDKSAMRTDLGSILPTDPALIAATRALLARRGALDLADVLGVA